MIGQTLGHYRIEAKLGEGGMGVVYRARDTQLQRDVALKVLPAETVSDPTARARLLAEARSASALNHPHICHVYEVNEAGEACYIAMEMAEGRLLSSMIPSGGLPVENVVRYGEQLADALAHAHARGILHRDLKSANVIITPEGRVKVLDFGLAERLGQQELEAVTRSKVEVSGKHTVAGTLSYMAPEALRGERATKTSDIWALGVVLYEMACGALPFAGRTGFELTSAILREPPTPLPAQVPPALRTIIQRCLANSRASATSTPAKFVPRSKRLAPRAASPQKSCRRKRWRGRGGDVP